MSRSYDSRRALCRRCLMEEAIDQAKLAEDLDQYAASLPEEIRADEAVYQRRIALCAQCPERFEFTCRRCGCYIQARAAKRRMRCPLPGGPLWVEQD